MARCSFCRHNIEVGTGKMLVLKDGRIMHFCSMKCEKNQMKLGRVGREMKWTFGYQHDKKAAKKAASESKTEAKK
ncbi:50S ribosomal protein L24 [Candidatus Woesearchaeota archaeon]|nr:50S ribosomal protein L24 [Candidatus Woesearchaeota archaeon]